MSDINARIILFNTSSVRQISSKFITINVNSNEQVETVVQKSLDLFLPSDRKPLHAVLLHHGRSLSANRRLSEHAITCDCVMQLVLKDLAPPTGGPSPGISQKAFQSLTELASQRRLSALSKILERPEHMDFVLSRSPFVVTAEMGVIYSLLLHSPQLLLCLLRDPHGVKRMLLQHPALAEVTLRIIQLHKSMGTAADNPSTTGTSSTAAVTCLIASQSATQTEDFSVHQDQSLDENEEEESDEDAEDASNTAADRPSASYRIPSQSVTSLSHRSGPTNRASNSRQSTISADAFRSALASALNTTPLTVAQPSTPVPPRVDPPPPPLPPRVVSPPQLMNPRQLFASQLASLRELGVTEEEVALQMLIATNGNLEEAINLMFG